ncbi:MAG: hypothetical protein WA130_13425 [Candidatus Methanoperedens sp.]
MTSFSKGDSLVSSPLMDGLFEDFCSFLEWILDVRLTVEARDLIRDLVHFWSTNNQMENLEEYLSIHSQVRKETKATQDYLREKLQIQFVADLRLLERSGNPGIRVVLKLYDAANTPLAPGNPPLTQETAECYMEFFYFMQMTLKNGKTPQPPPEITKKYFVRQLITKYSYMSREEQEWIGKSPELWAEYRSKWPRTSEAVIAELMPGWAQQINGSGNIPSFARDNIRDPRDLIKDSGNVNSDINKNVPEEKVLSAVWRQRLNRW